MALPGDVASSAYPAHRLHRAVPADGSPQPPSGAAWLHEIKHDGFRVIARKNGERVRLLVCKNITLNNSSLRGIAPSNSNQITSLSLSSARSEHVPHLYPTEASCPRASTCPE
jgi:hypothetical protein